MAEEYILLKDLNKAAKEFDLDKTTMNIISIEVPTHSFESFRENELKKDFEANLLDGDKLEDCGESMLNARYVWGWLKYLCQHFKKAEGDNKELIKKINDLRKVCGCGEDNEPTWETPYCEMTLDKVVEIIQVLDKEGEK